MKVYVLAATIRIIQETHFALYFTSSVLLIFIFKNLNVQDWIANTLKQCSIFLFIGNEAMHRCLSYFRQDLGNGLVTLVNILVT